MFITRYTSLSTNFENYIYNIVILWMSFIILILSTLLERFERSNEMAFIHS